MCHFQKSDRKNNNETAQFTLYSALMFEVSEKPQNDIFKRYVMRMTRWVHGDRKKETTRSHFIAEERQ